MIIFYGTRLCGKVDQVPGLFFVGTKFAHLYWVPLIPLGSTVVLEETAEGWRGVPFGLSLKSWLTAWVRTFCLFAGILSGGMVFVMLQESQPNWTIPLCVFAACVGILIFSYRSSWVTKASYERAMKIADRIGLNDEGKLMIDVVYGLVSEEEAKAALSGSIADEVEGAPVVAEQER